MTLDQEQKKFLLRLARASVEACVGETAAREALAAMEAPEWSQVRSGAFVTLKEAGDLRGCIGCMTAQDSLFRTVANMARSAALEDPRFEPLSARELAAVSIEISVLTPMEPIDGIEKIEVGRHGVHVSLGYRSAVFLPQVPIEWGWDRDTYVRQLLRKAGLPDAALGDPKTRFSVFEAIVFGE
jgi:uncharacterized protein